MDIEIKKAAVLLNEFLGKRNMLFSTAESCTGGAIAAAVTSIPGSSTVFNGGVVAYSNDVKHRVLGVSDKTLIKYGAVSEETVREMVSGVVDLMDSDCAVAVSGIAGPSGGTSEKPVGTVWLALYVNGEIETSLLQLDDMGRENNIRTVVFTALDMLNELLNRKVS